MTSEQRNTITSVTELIKAVNDLSVGPLMFRGQSRDWPLLPAIGRFPCEDYAGNWREFHEDVIDRFLRLGAPYFFTKPTSDVVSWVYAQHHGLPTRLLDTTLNPLKAMYFAVNDPREDSYDGVLWIIAYDGWRENLDEKYKEYWDSEITAFLPAQIHPRLTAQEGAFICYPLPDNTDPLATINNLPNELNNRSDLECHKFIIPAEEKVSIRREIGSLGAKHSLLFPDLDGVAKEVSLGLYENIT